MVNEKEKKQIEIELKKLLEKFASKLEAIKNLPEESLIIKEKSMRKEGNGQSEKELKKRMLVNAKNKNGDFIIAEEKSW